jgi:hypothetical protein
MVSFFNRFWYIVAILIIAALIMVTWANYKFVQENPGGNDFLVHWVGTRALLVDGLSPYSDTVAERIQTLAYGRPAEPGEHELRVAYPLYSGLIFLPYALIADYDLARAVWMTTLEVALIGLAFLSLNLTRWKMSLWLLPLFLLFSVFWYHSLRPLINGNTVILVALFLAGAFAAIKSERDELAGILLALSTIKPHLVLLPIIFVLIWTISFGRWKTLGWMLISLGLLSISAALFIPDWPLQNLREIMAYVSYNPPGTPGAVFEIWLPATGRKLGWGLSVILGLILLVEWILVRRKEFRWFLWTAGLTLVVSQWIGIQTDPGNFILLFLPLVLVFAMWAERWGRAGDVVIIFVMGLLFVLPWVIFLQTITYGDQPMQHPVMFFPLPLFLLISLYWVRWWAIRPRSMLVEELRAYEDQV